MGKCGLATRLLAFRYAHSFLSFAAPDSTPVHRASPIEDHTSTGTAPGQVTLSEMRDVYRVQSITANTKLIGLMLPKANSSQLVIDGNVWLSKNAPDTTLVPLELASGEHEAQAGAAIGEAGPLVGFLSQGSDGKTIYVRVPTNNRRRAFESMIAALRWLVEPPEARSSDAWYT